MEASARGDTHLVRILLNQSEKDIQDDNPESDTMKPSDGLGKVNKS